MAEDRVQLKQEEIVGNEVVLSDINPKSNTKSIDDPTTGASLDKTLERMWQSINNKLSRIVNSVNGRTGVVVLDSSDVGLGNVDNVSFADIKQWVITRTAQEFGFKRLALFNSLRELDDTINHEWLHDEVYANKPFYSRHGYESNGVMDNRGYIGYIYYDSSVNKLKHTEMVLDTIGSADNSIIYNEQGHQNGETRDYSGSGRIGVNIWTYEDALEVYNNISSENKADSGLRINKDNIAPKLYFFDGVYGDGTTSLDPNALLYYAAEDIDQDKPNAVDIYIDGTKIEYNNSNSLGQHLYNNTNYIKQSFKVNDLILCNFNDENYLEPVGTGHDNDRVLNIEMNPLLMLKRPCIGQVTKAPTAQDPSADYEIRFYSIRQNIYRGLKYDTIHTNASDYPNGALSVDLLTTSTIKKGDDLIYVTTVPNQKFVNLSGMNAMRPYDPKYQHTKTGAGGKRTFRTILPTGVITDIYQDDTTGLPNEEGSMFILPNYSLCVIPYTAHVEQNNRLVSNWPMSAPPIPNEPNWDYGNNDTTLLGINLVKGVNKSSSDTRPGFVTNLSGLRIDDEVDPINGKWLGIGDNSGISIQNHSGGLSVNVGSFLEIGSSDASYAKNRSDILFYEEGKVNVRIDKMRGLHESYDNKLSVNISENTAPKDHDENHLSGGLKFTDDYGDEATPQYGVLSVNTGGNARGLSIKNNTPCDVKYNIASNPIHVINESNVLGVQLYDLTREISQTISETITPSGLEIKYGIFEEDIVPLLPNSNVYSKKVWNTVFDLDYELNLDPAQYPNRTPFKDNEVYIAAGSRWIVSTSELVYHPYVVFYSDKDQYDQVLDSIRSDPTIWPASKQCHVLIEDSSDPDVYTITGKAYGDIINLHLPDTDFNGRISADDASFVRRMTAIMTSILPSIYVKKDATTGGIEGFYSDPEKTTPFVIPSTAVEGDLFATMNYVEEFNVPGNSELLYEITYECYKPQGSDNLELRVFKPSGLGDQAPDPWTESSFIEMLRRSDADQNGRITTVDSTWILSFYAELQNEYRGMSLTDAWIAFLDAHGKTVSDDPIITIFSCKYEKGVRIKYDESRGITYSPVLIEGSLIDGTDRSDYDINTLRANAKHDAISIKIADPSSGVLTFDKYICGGLRFGTNGYLGVRINNSNKYNAALPSKNNGTQSDDLSIGTRGLHIYDKNILGIQLTEDGDLDNGELCFDRKGNLRISATFNPGKADLTISGKLNGTTTNIPYNGSEPVTITLGPGLCFSEDA